MTTRAYCLLISAVLALGCEPAPASPIDAAVPSIDAAPGEDASVSTEDASSPLDAGEPPSDGGPPMGSMVLANAAVRDIALGGGHVYFATETMIGRVPVGGGTVETVQTFSTSAPNGIAADDTRIVWAERNASSIWGQVNSCPLSGCGAMPTAIPHGGESAGGPSMDGGALFWLSGTRRMVLGESAWSVVSPGLTVADVAVEGGDVFWLDGGIATTPGAVYRCPATGSSCTPVLVSDAVGRPSRISVSGDHVLVLSDTGVFHMGRDGSGLTRLGDGRTAGATDIVTDGVRVYWAILENLYGCAIASCTPASIDVGSGGLDWTSGLDIDATHLYWGTRSSVRRIEL